MQTPNRDPRTIGASDISVIMGESGYESILNLFLRLTGKTDWGDTSPSALWGQDVEKAILDNYSRRFMGGGKFTEYGRTFYDAKNQNFAATPDAVYLQAGREPIIVDAKNYLHSNFILQAMWQIHCFNSETRLSTPAHHAIFHCADWGEPQPVKYDWNEELFDVILDAVMKFMKDYVEPQKMPAPDGHVKARKALMEIYPMPQKDKKMKIPATERIEFVAKELNEMKEIKNVQEEAIRAFENEICQYLDEKNAYGVEFRDGGAIIRYDVSGKLRYRDAVEHLISTGAISQAQWLNVSGDDRFKGSGSRIIRITKGK